METEHRCKYALMYSEEAKHYFVVSWGQYDPSLSWSFIIESDDFKWLVTCAKLAKETKG